MSATNTQSHEDRQVQVLNRDHGCDCSRNTSVQWTIFSCRRVHYSIYSSRSLRNSAFWRWMSLRIPVMKLHTVGWWPAVPPLDAVGAASYAAGPCSVLIPGFDGECGCTISGWMCVRRMWSVHPADRRLLAATQQEVRTPDDASPGEVAPDYLSLSLRWTVAV